MDEDVLVAVELCAWHAFGLETRRMDSLPDPAFAYDSRRLQYGSVPILRELAARCPSDATRLFAITERDLFIPMLTFVYGQAQLDGKVALVSLARLHQEFYGLPANAEALMGRLIKETLHELGHTFGLTHCTLRSCVMSVATNLPQLDAKGADFCTTCKTLVAAKSRSFAAIRG